MADRETLLRFTIPSDDAAVLPAVERILEAVQRAGYVGEGRARLKVALVELVRNAIEHGNRFDPERAVAFEIEREEAARRIAITVRDEGAGLDPERLERRLEDVAFGSRRGRGLAMVQRILGGYPAVQVRGNAVTIRFGPERFA
ncbi:MAG: ATP-binding protein [Planctomycetota bacterium]|nr:MAG: ATP-binding protein [Planctomycetota bacterium]